MNRRRRENGGACDENLENRWPWREKFLGFRFGKGVLGFETDCVR